MLTTFIDKLSGFLSRRYMTAYWAPAFIGLGLFGLLVVLRVGFAELSSWWDGQTATQQLLLGFGALLVVTVIAYLLQALTTPIVRVYEGYWPPAFGRLRSWAEAAEERRRQALDRAYHASLGAEGEAEGEATSHAAQAQWRELYYGYPSNPALVRATRLGNVMTAAEGYSFFSYQADAVIWWPRLVTLLPEELRSQIDDALTPVIALLNLCTILMLWAVAGGAYVFWVVQDPVAFVAVFLGGSALAWLAYRAATSQAQNYGDMIRVAFDLHRQALLKQLNMPTPSNLVDEMALWQKLGAFHYYRRYPWFFVAQPPTIPQDGDRLAYASQQSAPPGPKSYEVTVKIADTDENEDADGREA